MHTTDVPLSPDERLREAAALMAARRRILPDSSPAYRGWLGFPFNRTRGCV